MSRPEFTPCVDCNLCPSNPDLPAFVPGDATSGKISAVISGITPCCSKANGFEYIPDSGYDGSYLLTPTAPCGWQLVIPLGFSATACGTNTGDPVVGDLVVAFFAELNLITMASANNPALVDSTAAIAAAFGAALGSVSNAASTAGAAEYALQVYNYDPTTDNQAALDAANATAAAAADPSVIAGDIATVAATWAATASTAAAALAAAISATATAVANYQAIPSSTTLALALIAQTNQANAQTAYDAANAVAAALSGAGIEGTMGGVQSPWITTSKATADAQFNYDIDPSPDNLTALNTAIANSDASAAAANVPVDAAAHNHSLATIATGFILFSGSGNYHTGISNGQTACPGSPTAGGPSGAGGSATVA